MHKLDQYGYHIASCNGDGGAIRLHNYVAQVLVLFLRGSSLGRLGHKGIRVILRNWLAACFVLERVTVTSYQLPAQLNVKHV